jgi:hypothetical protein
MGGELLYRYLKAFFPLGSVGAAPDGADQRRLRW